MWLFDADTLRFVEVNDATIAQYGYSRDEFMAMTIAQIRPESEVPKLLEYLKVQRPPLRQAGVWQHRRKDGSLLYADVSSHSIVDNERHWVLVIAADATDRVLAEERSRQMLEQLERAEAAAAMGSWSLDTFGRLTISNQATKILDLSPDDGLPSLADFVERLHPDDRQTAFARMHWTGDLVPAWQETVRTSPSCGPVRYLVITGQSITGSDGRPVRHEGLLRDVTESRLRDMELQLRSKALNCTANAVLITDPQGVIEWVNPAFTAITGYLPEEVIGRTPRILKSGQHDANFYRQMWECLHSGQVWRGSLVNQKKDGSLYIEQQTVTPILDDSGHVTHFVAIKEDLTEHIEAEQQLNASREFLRHVVEQAPNCIKVVDHEGRLVDMNAAGLALIEANSIEDVKGMKVRDLIAPAHREVFDKMHQKVLRGSPAEGSFDLIGLQGRVRSVVSRGVPITGGTEGEVHQLAVTHDVTQQKQLSNFNQMVASILTNVASGTQLPQTLRKLAELIESSDPGVMAAIITITPEQTIESLFAPKFQGSLIRKMKGKSLEEFDIAVACSEPPDIGRGASSEGPVRLFSWTLPFYNRLGRTVGYVKVYSGTRDAPHTEELEMIATVGQIAGLAVQRNESEAELRNANEELEQRVADRTRDLELANRELEAFTYSVSHDLNAPLRVVSGFAQMLLDDHAHQLDDDGRKLIDVIVRRTQNMGELIRDLLTLSRATTADLVSVPVDMTQLVHSALSQVLESASSKVSIEVPSLPKAYGDPLLLKQVWTNLLSNAVKFSSRTASPRIEIGASEENGEQIFWVRDNGAGYDPQCQDMLFKVFWRGHTQSEFEGNGAGLAIVERIVHRHGGRVWAEGRPGEGATFWFSLPTSGQ